MVYKQARRRDDDIAIVNGAFFFDIRDDQKTKTNVIRFVCELYIEKPYRFSYFHLYKNRIDSC